MWRVLRVQLFLDELFGWAKMVGPELLLEQPANQRVQITAAKHRVPIIA